MTRRTVSRRSLAAVACTALLAPRAGDAARAPAVLLSGLRWTGEHPTFPLFRGVASAPFDGAALARVATRSDPLRYKAYLAFSRLASVLERRITPRTEVYAVRLGALLAAVEGDSAGRALLRDEAAVLNDGTVMVMVSDVVHGKEVDFNGWELRPTRTWAETSGPLPPERRGLVGAYVDTLVLDYLAGNVARTTVVLTEPSGLCAVENAGAFMERVDPGALDGVLLQLKRVARFSRTLIERLRRAERAQFEAALHAGPFSAWLVATRPISEMLERSRVVQSLVAARAAEAGTERTLGLP